MRRPPGPGRQRAAGELANREGMHGRWPGGTVRDADQGHNTTSSWDVCAGPLTQAFIEQASVAHLNTGCLASASAPPFDLTLP